MIAIDIPGLSLLELSTDNGKESYENNNNIKDEISQFEVDIWTRLCDLHLLETLRWRQ